jgi:glucose/arabinose dehydrogenase/PKD repeat protein
MSRCARRFVGALALSVVAFVLIVPAPHEAVLTAAVPTGYIEETVTTVDRPVAMAFLPDGRLLIGSQGTAASGQAKIYVYKNGALLEEPYTTVLDVYIGGSETGLLGIAVDPNFATNGFVYVFITLSSTDQVVRRFTTVGDVAVSSVDLITDLPTQGTNHNGGGLLIHENRLYVSVGENGTPDAAQLTNNRLGKVLRFNLDGTIPTDNPFGPGNPVWSYGLRNPFRLAARPGTGQIFASENGPAGYDEVNRIVRGGNYGWPLYVGYTTDPAMVSPIWSSGLESGIVPTDLLFYQGAAMPEFQGQLFIAGWSSDTVYRATLDASGDVMIGGLVPFVTGVDQPVDLEIAPDGSLWYCTRPGQIRRVYRVSTSNVPPTASFTRTPASGPPPLVVHVNGSTSSDSDGSIANYHWEWGDGTPPRSGPTRISAGHNYRTAGTFTITLTVTDNHGATASSSQQVVVSTGNNTPPAAHIEEVSTYSGVAPLTVDFLGHGHDTDGDLLRYDWDFGDGSAVVTYTNIAPDTNVFLPHTFTTEGTYTVRLTVTDPGGLSAVNTVEIVVTPASGGGGGGTNLLINPGFEQGLASWTGGGSQATIVSSPVRSGSAALRIAATSAGQTALEQIAPVVGGQPYEVSAWVQTEALTGGALVMVVWQDSAGRSLYIDRTPVVQGTTGWMRLAQTFVAPSQAARARVSVRLTREADNAGTAWFDDVVLDVSP